jgi:MFS family permease
VPPEIAAGVFYGLSSALLALGITRRGWHHMLIFLAYPYWAGMLAAQWIPLIMASTFFWWLMPAAPAKPQIGLPIVLAKSERKGIFACIAVIGVSLIVMPHWPAFWFAETSKYVRFIPLLLLPGPLLIAALIRYRDRDAWLLFLASCMPQRWFYDSFLLWLIPKTRRQIVYTAGLSWIPGIWRWYHTPHHVNEVGRMIILCFYLPMLAVLLWPTRQDIPQSTAAQSQTGSGATTAESELNTAD